MMVHVRSASLADLDLEKVLEFRDGIPGFPASRRHALRDSARTARSRWCRDKATAFRPVTPDQESDTIHFNLLGPSVVTSRTRQGRQVVRTDLRQPLPAALQLARA
jgi:flagellar assembly factor FliW